MEIGFRSVNSNFARLRPATLKRRVQPSAQSAPPVPRDVRWRADGADQPAFNTASSIKENYMYIGGGILGTILVIFLVLWLLRRV